VVYRPSRLVEEARIGQAAMGGDDGRGGRHDQERAARDALDVAAEAENETRDEVDDARGLRIVHVLQVDDDRDFLAVVLTDGGGIAKVPRAHDGDLDAVAHGKLVIQGFIVVLNLIDVLGNVPVPAELGVIVVLVGTEPSTGVASHYAGLRPYKPVLGHRQARLRWMTETTANQATSNSNNASRL